MLPRLAWGMPIVKKRVVLLALLVVLATAYGLAAWRWSWPPLASAGWNGAGRVESTQKARDADLQDLDDRQVRALGHLKPTAGVLTIGALVGDRIDRLYVREGDTVEKGQVLAELASRPLRLLEEQALAAQLAETQARRQAEEMAADARIRLAELNLIKAQSRQAEISAQEKQVALAESNLELAKRDAQRLEGLSAALVSKQELERQRLLVKKAEAEMTAAAAALETLRESSRFAQDGAQAELEAAKAAKQQVLNSIPLASLDKKRELAELQTAQTLVTAPAAGTILRVFTREGEPIANKPILQMADLSDLTCVAEVYEGDLPRVRVGQPAEISSRAFPPTRPTVRGVVTRIGGMISTPELRSLDPFAPSDRHVVEVGIALEKGAVPEAARLANLQVDVTILTPGEGPDENSPGVAESRP